MGYLGNIRPRSYDAETGCFYIHNMTSILSDTSSDFSPAALDYSIPGEPATVHDLLIQKSDGIYVLAVWGDQVAGASANVIINLGRTFPLVNVYDVTSGTIPNWFLSDISSGATDPD